jgi:16S rRNA (uracil1498-N3)-methyltransferase
VAFRSDLPALFVPDGFAESAPVALPADEIQHVRALRLRVGQSVLLLDGRGGRSEALIEGIDKRAVVVRAGPVVFDASETGPYIALSYGLLADKSRAEWCVEKGVELGVRQFLPVETERSEGHPHRSRLERVAVAALKQSQRSWLPTIEEPVAVTRLVDRFGEFDRIYVCHETASLDRSLADRLLAERPHRTLVAIGPEGGFSEREIAGLADAGAQIVSLGDARLRAETAAIVAVALVQMIANNDHGLRFNPGIE